MMSESRMTQLRLVSSQPSPPRHTPAVQGDHPCLEAYRLEFDYLARTLRRLGVRRDDVEDLAHDVFLVLYQAWDKYDPARPLRAYLFGIAFRVAANYRRKLRKERHFTLIDVDTVEMRPDRAVEAFQARATVLKALERIPLPRRAVFILHDIDQLPMAEIASTLSIYRFTGYSRLRKARQEFAAAVAALSRIGNEQ